MSEGKREEATMRKRSILLAVVVAASLVAAVAAWAGNPHFLRVGEPTLVYGDDAGTGGAAATAMAATTASTTVGDPRVLVPEIVVVGVSDGVETTLVAPFEAVYVCVNGGGNVPSAANKTVLAGNLSASATFPAARNGRATGSLLTGPLPSAADAAAMTGFACPAGQVLEFDQVVFSGLVVSVAGGESMALDTTLVSTSVHGLG
jgi:hypothetical protein